jgi:hypothetical protein
MRSRRVPVGAAITLAAVAVLTTLFAGVLLLGGAAERSPATDPQRSPSTRVNTPVERHP